MKKNYNPILIKKYYDEYGIKEWEKFDVSPLEEIKLFIHNYYLKKYIRKGTKILEIGAGPGRFTKLLNKIGCEVLVADISPVQLELNKKNAKKFKFNKCIIDWIEMDICNMKQIKSNEIDVVLAYGGPLSYVFERKDIAVKECKRVLRKSGLLISSSMSLFGTMHRFLKGVMDIPIPKNRIILKTGDLTPKTEPNNRHSCHMYRAKEYKKLFLKNGFKIIEMSASNSISTNNNKLLIELKKNKRKWKALLEFELEACTSEGFLDGGTHIISVAQKK